MKKDTTPAVDAISAIALRGNVIPHLWYQHPRLRSDTRAQLVNLPAIILLADIVYWYRYTEERDEPGGLVISVRKKFAADKLQKSYAEWGQGFGLTKGQVQDAIAFLKERGIITVEARTLTVQGRKIPNVIFLEPVPDVIAEMCQPPEMEEEGIPEFRDISPEKTLHTTRNSKTTIPKKQETNTENTTKSTQRVQQQPAAPQSKPQTERESVVALAAALTQDLIAQGVKPKVAQSLVKTYPEESIRQQLAWLPQRKYVDAAATLVESIKEGYDAPAAAKKAVPRPKTRAVTRDTAERPPVLTEEQQAASRDAMRATLERLRGRANATGAASMGETL